MKGSLYSRLLFFNLRMSFSLRTAVAFVFTFYQLAAGLEVCIWCDMGTENNFLTCFSDKMRMNPDLNIEPNLLESMTKSLTEASSVINTPGNVKNKMMNGALSREVATLITSIASSGRKKDITVANIMRPLKECYTMVTGLTGANFATFVGKTVMDTISDMDTECDNNDYPTLPLLIQPRRKLKRSRNNIRKRRRYTSNTGKNSPDDATSDDGAGIAVQSQALGAVLPSILSNIASSVDARK